MNCKSISFLGLALAAALAGTTASAAVTEASSTMTVSAQLTTACEVSASPAIDFGTFAALLSSNDRTSSTGSTLQVACSHDALPKIYVSNAREMTNGTDVLPFNLSLTAGAAANDLASTSGAANSLTVTQDGAMHDVVIYGRVAATNFQALSSGSYTTDVTVAVVY